MLDDDGSIFDTHDLFERPGTGLAPTVRSSMPASGDFFAPLNPAQLGRALFDEYKDIRSRMERVARTISADEAAVAVFLQAQRESFDRYVPDVATIFKLEEAIAHLDAKFWERVMAATDIWDHLPQARRNTWGKAIRNCTAPPFTPGNVEETLRDLLARRESFLAERVDGIFQGLSGEHVTNRPQGFSKRMIIASAFQSWGEPTGHHGGLFHDLRGIIRRFMGCTSLVDAHYYSSNRILKSAREYSRGQWVSVDGGALRVRAYKKGTIHIEVHPDMAWRLNAILASIHPRAIPASARQKPPRATKGFQPLRRPIFWAVIACMSMDRYARKHSAAPAHKTVQLDYQASREARDEARQILEALGGVFDGGNAMSFDYDVTEVFHELVSSGVMPDAKTHQYYPTPPELAAAAVSLADIGPDDTCLEPSAGQGGLAGLMPAERTTCVELSRLHCAVLAGKGLEAVEADFVEWAATAPMFDRIVMNPPFSRRRALLHLETASRRLKPGGRLVAILPASMRDKAESVPDGFSGVWSQDHEGAFKGTSMTVAMLTLEHL